MTAGDMIILAAALLAVLLGTLWIVGVTRRRAQRRTRLAAARVRTRSEAWQRLNHSANGAP